MVRRHVEMVYPSPLHVELVLLSTENSHSKSIEIQWKIKETALNLCQWLLLLKSIKITWIVAASSAPNPPVNGAS